MKQTKESKRTARLIDKFSKENKNDIKSIQRRLALILAEYFIERFVTKDNTIKSTATNLRIASNVTNLSSRFHRTVTLPIMNKIIGRLFSDMHSVTESYFSKLTDKDVETRKASNAAKQILKIKLGVSGKSINKESGLFKASQADPIWDNIRSQAIDAVSSGRSIVDFKKEIDRFVKGAEDKSGEVERYFNGFTNDIFSQYQRQQSQLMAEEMGMNYAIYQGGLIKTSRDFCEERNGKVFSREEILKFGTSNDLFGGYTNKSKGEFQGKNKNYSPITDLGGYNCRHQLDWISEELAFALRPELEVNG